MMFHLIVVPEARHVNFFHECFIRVRFSDHGFAELPVVPAVKLKLYCAIRIHTSFNQAIHVSSDERWKCGFVYTKSSAQFTGMKC